MQGESTNRIISDDYQKLITYTVQIFDNKKLLYIKLFGELYANEFKAISYEYRLKANKLNYRLIFDFRKANNHIMIADAYFWFDNLAKTSFDLLKINVIHLVNDQNESFFNFFKLTAGNKGVDIQTFKDEDSAFKWLSKLK